MLFAQLPLHEQVILAFSALTLLLSLFMLAHPKLTMVIRLFALQGLFLAATTALVAYDMNEPHLYISAALTLLLKVLFVPYLLMRMVRHFKLEFELDAVAQPARLLLLAGALIVFCYHVTLPIAELSLRITHNVLGISMAIVLMGMLILVTRRKAISQVVGFMSMENGLFFAAIAITQGMPMVVELGVAFDVLVAAIVFGVFFLHLKESIDSLDIGDLSHLSERE